jgi:hypothetical protein
LVSHNGFGNFLQLSNVKPSQVCSAPAGRLDISTTLEASQKGIMPLEMPTGLNKKERK